MINLTTALNSCVDNGVTGVNNTCLAGAVQSNYPYPGRYLGTGNRCGHDPASPAWYLFNVPKTKNNIPHVMRKLLEGVKNYYYSPAMLPTLANLNGKRNIDGQPRLNRSEAREAESLIMAAILHLTEYATLRVGTPLPSGEFIHRSCTEIAQVAGLIDPRSPEDKPEPSQRFWRGFRRLKNAGAFDVHRQYEKIIGEYEKAPNGMMKPKMRARPAIKNLNFHFLVAIGCVSYEALKKFRTWCSNKLKKARLNHRGRNPEQHDADIARRKIREKQVLGGTLTNVFKKKRSKAIPDSNKDKELQRQYSLEMAQYMSDLIASNSGKSLQWARDKAREKYPPFAEWVKTKTV